MRITLDDFWKLPAGMDIERERREPTSSRQVWWVIGPDGEVMGKVSAEFSDEELALLFQ
jgi:hypothetical protein